MPSRASSSIPAKCRGLRRRSAKERERERENEDVFFNMRDIVHLVGKKRKAFSKYIYIYLSIHPSIGCKHTQKGKVWESLRRGVNRLRPSRRMKKRRASFPIGRRGEKRRRSHFHIQRGISQRNCMWVPVEPVSLLLSTLFAQLLSLRISRGLEPRPSRRNVQRTNDVHFVS
jgi:hypothetical protein